MLILVPLSRQNAGEQLVLYLANFERVEVLSVLDDFAYRVLSASERDRFAAKCPRQCRFRRRHCHELDDHLLGRSVDRYVRLLWEAWHGYRLTSRCCRSPE